MPLAMLPIPEISISLASPEEPVSEPFSPFSPKGPYVEEDDTNWRATLLSPPPIISPRKLSPLRPADTPVKGQGIERERFEALLLTSRERNGVLGGKKSVDLRKEIAIKVHKSKQGMLTSWNVLSCVWLMCYRTITLYQPNAVLYFCPRCRLLRHLRPL